MKENIKVLLVDDESWTRDIVRAFGEWERLGMEIAGEADDGAEALRLTDELKPGIVITDMRMPGVDGVRLLEALKERFPDIKAVVISGYDDFEYAKHALRNRAVDYLLKPVDPKELNAALRKCKDELETAQADRAAIALDIDVSYLLAPYKQQLRTRYNELNAEGIASVFGQLSAELERNGSAKPGMPEQAAQELLLLLKELMAANSQSAESLQIAYTQDVFADLSGTMRFIQGHYEDMLERLVQQRRFKNKLNLDEVRLFMEKHFTEPLTLEQLARAFFVSKEYLSKMFKQEFGHTVTDYLLHLRMDKAKEWLLDGSIPIKAIAEMAGYEDVTYFYRVFKKHFGVAPGEMRKSGEV
ncbi:response regulator [Paenibacillus sp. N4]|uniref:response regulator transcription factor n=1 Tax=Paenibacillus vietnamensis TaxID=2590547 RepID=UPI001CD17186|nr:response regulator [Paenibacillus vietnamensis]MCA0754781.1 response regulator [Paenibacillus vietnamensis]